MAKVAPRDLILYFALTALPIATFLLAGYPDTQFFVSLYLVSMVVLLWLKLYHKEGDQIVVYDQNLNFRSMVAILTGAAAVLLVSSVFVGMFAQSCLYVPQAKLDISYSQIYLPPFWSDILFQATLVVPAEECTKLVVMLALFVWAKDKFSHSLAQALSVGVSVGGWALLHTLRNPDYQGQYAAVMLAAALIAGIIMFLVMRYTKSLLAAMMVHFIYNAVVIYLEYFG